MKKRTGGKVLALVLMLASSGGVVAQGYYELIPYYGNDPFVFCTFGVPTDCWFPINPATGTFGVWNDYCFNPVSAAQYARVCPHAFVPVGQVKSPRREVDKERKSARSGIS